MDTQQLPRIKNSANANDFPKENRDCGGKSATVPDQTMSLREIVRRYTRGVPLPVVAGGYFDEEESEGIDLRTLDISEVDEMVKKARETVKENEGKKAKHKKQKEDEEYKQRVEKEIHEKITKESKLPPPSQP